MQTECVQHDGIVKPIMENLNEINQLINATNKTLILDLKTTGHGLDFSTVLNAGGILDLTPEIKTHLVNAKGTISFIKQGYLLKATDEIKNKVNEMCLRYNTDHLSQNKRNEQRKKEEIVDSQTILKSYETIISDCGLYDKYMEEVSDSLPRNAMTKERIQFAESFRQKNIVNYYQKAEIEREKEKEEFAEKNPGKELLIERCPPVHSVMNDMVESVEKKAMKIDNSEVILPDEEIIW